METYKPDIQLRIGQVARLVGVTSQTMGNWAKAGKGPEYFIVGTERRYLLSKVLEWLKASGGES
jgi:hypothetical protein